MMLQMALFTLRVVGTVILGFVAPGYCLARCLRAGDRLLWSFPLSLLVLFVAVFITGCLGLPVTAAVIAAILLAITLVLAAIGPGHRGVVSVPMTNSQTARQQQPLLTWIKACIFGAISILLAV
jgi:hypothetical protein